MLCRLRHSRPTKALLLSSHISLQPEMYMETLRTKARLARSGFRAKLRYGFRIA